MSSFFYISHTNCKIDYSNAWHFFSNFLWCKKGRNNNNQAEPAEHSDTLRKKKEKETENSDISVTSFFVQTLLRNLQLQEVQLKEVKQKKHVHQNSQFRQRKKKHIVPQAHYTHLIPSLFLQMLISRKLYPRRDWLWSLHGRRVRRRELRTGTVIILGCT